jgi:hypothetical protein
LEVNVRTELNADFIAVLRIGLIWAVKVKNAVFLDVMPCGSLRTYVTDKPIASIIRVTRICEYLASAFFGC